MAVRVEYAVQESLTNIRRNLFITFHAVMVVTVSLGLAGGVALVNRAGRRVANLWTGQVSVAVFLNDDMGLEQQRSLQNDLLAMPEVAKVTFESKDKAVRHFKQIFSNQPAITESITSDALPASFRVKLKDPTKFAVIRDRLAGRPGIRQIQDEAQ